MAPGSQPRPRRLNSTAARWCSRGWSGARSGRRGSCARSSRLGAGGSPACRASPARLGPHVVAVVEGDACAWRAGVHQSVQVEL
eukprot:5155854-Pyramimonas_sp.AAC.1